MQGIFNLFSFCPRNFIKIQLGFGFINYKTLQEIQIYTRSQEESFSQGLLTIHNHHIVFIIIYSLNT